MTSPSRTFIAVAACVLTSVMVSAQAQPPARDRGAVTPAVTGAPAGTGSISGVVVTADAQAAPLRYVPVSLMRGQIAAPQITMTDEYGRFSFSALPDDQYTLAAQKAGWVSVARGLRAAGGQMAGIPIRVEGGAAVSGVALRLQRGGVIAGTVRWPGGRPAAGQSVFAFSISTIDGQRTSTMQAVPVTTDDLGRYRAFGLAPGQYVVRVQSSPMGMELLMPDGSSLRQTLPSEVVWAEAVAAATAGATTPAPPTAGPTVTWAPVFAPGTASIADAALMTVGAGEERSGIDVELQLVQTTTITGTVTKPDGTPAANASVALHLPASLGHDDVFGQMLGAARTTTRPDGTFTLAGVRPGAYDLVARSGTAGQGGDAAALAAMFSAMGMGASGAASSWARERLVIEGQPVAPLALHLRDGYVARGRVVFASGKGPASGVRVSIGSFETLAGLPDMAMFRGNQTMAQVGADGTFEATGLMPGNYKVSVVMPGLRLLPTVPGSGWLVASVRVGDLDVSDSGLEVAGDVADLVVAMTDTPSELTGRVLDGAGAPVFENPVVVFSADRRHWRPGSRRVHALQPSTDGSFIVAGLPAGQYYVAVVTDLDSRELTSATFLESLVASAFSVTLADGERKVQEIRIK